MYDELPKLKSREAKRARIAEIAQALKFLAMGLTPEDLEKYQNTGGRAGGPGAPLYLPSLSAVLVEVEKAFASRAYTARAA